MEVRVRPPNWRGRVEQLESRLLLHAGFHDTPPTTGMTQDNPLREISFDDTPPFTISLEPAAVEFDVTAPLSPAVAGEWTPLMSWPIVAVHAHLLSSGQVMAWSRADDPRFWDPATNSFTMPAMAGYNVFCSGHSFMPDGRLLVTGGHTVEDGYQQLGIGLPNASIYDPVSNTWTRLPDMNAGRWYPTNTTLASGDVLVIAGQIDNTNGGTMNPLPEVWQAAGGWRDLTDAELVLPTYPWMYQVSSGLVFNAGSNETTRYLDTSGTGQWIDVGNHVVADREAGTSVMYADGKVLAIGGGNPPTASAEVIDLSSATPAWRSVSPMAHARRQANSTILPDGTVLVTGGSSAAGFNNPAGAVFAAELWDPATESWTTLASAAEYRGYHSTALLLPDGRVLSAGGEGSGDQRRSGQLFSPPYLFNADGSTATRPTINSAPTAISYGQTFFVGTPDAASIARVSLMRLGSVTHSFNPDQRINFLEFSQTAGGLTVTAPVGATLAPPGYYMLFLLDDQGVPSVATIFNVAPGFAVRAGQGGASPDDEGRAVVADPDGNTFVAGSFLYADGSSDSTSGGGDIFVGKYGPGGVPAWQHVIGSSGADRARGMARDSAGNIYVTGTFQKTVDFDPGSGTANRTSGGGYDIFVLKLDRNGVSQWAAAIGGSSSTADIGYGVAVDALDNVLLTGQFGGTVDFNPSGGTANLTSAGSSDIFVLKLTSGGGFVWAKRMGGGGSDRATAIAVDAVNRVYTTGSFRSTADFDPGAGTFTLTSVGSTDVFISRLNSSGSFSMAKQLGGSSSQEAHDIELDSSGFIYTTGYFFGSADFNPGTSVVTLTSAGDSDVFISKLNPFGSYVFAKQIGGSGNDRGRGLVIGTDGGISLTGHFSGTVDFDPGAGIAELSSAGSSDVFLARLSGTGGYVSARRFSGTGLDMGRAIARDSGDNLYLTGYFKGTVAFDTGNGTTTLTSSGGKDVFVTRLAAGSGAAATQQAVAVAVVIETSRSETDRPGRTPSHNRTLHVRRVDRAIAQLYTHQWPGATRANWHRRLGVNTWGTALDSVLSQLVADVVRR
jgi:hypothetical protein